MKEVAFIRMPKCAGHSIRDFISNHELSGHTRTVKWQELPEFKEEVKANPNKYVVFTIVRNPFDRAVSFFSFAKSKNLIPKNMTFPEYAQKVYDMKPGRPDAPEGSEEERFWSHACPLTEHLGDCSFINHILKIENLPEDFKNFCKEVDWPTKELKKQNTYFHKPYWEYYNDESEKLIDERFLDDINQFGYQFERKTLPFYSKTLFCTKKGVLHIYERARRSIHSLARHIKKRHPHIHRVIRSIRSTCGL